MKRKGARANPAKSTSNSLFVVESGRLAVRWTPPCTLRDFFSKFEGYKIMTQFGFKTANFAEKREICTPALNNILWMGEGRLFFLQRQGEGLEKII